MSVLSFLLAGALLTGSSPQAQPPAAPPGGVAAVYVVGPGDVLEVTVLDQADVSRSTTVQPDGRFTMPLLGDIEVAGKTVTEIQQMITEKLSKDFLVNPRVEVRVKEYASQFALVLGEVINPGRRALRGSTRVIDILIECGGFRPSASGEILIQRSEGTFPGGEKSVRFRLGNTAGMTEKDRSNAELLLKNGDVVTAGPKYFVTVDGEVARPGRVVIDSDLTLLGVIAQSGGLGKYASSKVRVIRKPADGIDTTGFGPCDGTSRDLCLVIDLGAIRKGKVADVILAPNDKVVVSRKRF